jgi:Recombination directionality factor-like
VPIRDLQMSIRELGRIRMGDQVPTGNSGRKRPRKLEKFRLTSPQRNLIEAAAATYGGEAQGWDNDGRAEWEVYVEADAIDVHVPPGDHSLSQWMEMWSGGGCQRRCDGQTEQLRMTACICRAKHTVYLDDDPAIVDETATRQRITEMARRAKKDGGPDGCLPVTRLSLFVPKLPGLGVWRLESHGYYAATEIAGVAQLLAAATSMGRSVPATLRINRRRIKRPGSGTKDFIVPVLDVPESLGDVLEQLGMPLGSQTQLGGPPVGPALAPGRRGTERVPLGDQYELPAGQVAATPGIGQHAPTIPDAPDPTDVEPPVDGEVVDEPPPPPPEPEARPITERQRRRLMALLAKLDWNDDDMRHLVIRLATQDETESSTELDTVQYDQVVTILDLVAYGLITLGQDSEGNDAFMVLRGGEPDRPVQLPVDVEATQAVLAKLPTPEGWGDPPNDDAPEPPDAVQDEPGPWGGTIQEATADDGGGDDDDGQGDPPDADQPTLID